MKKYYLILFLAIFFVILPVTYWNFKISTEEKIIPQKVQGIVLPHHELAAEMLNKSFQKIIEEVSPNIVVIYGTNHYFPISDTYITTTNIKDQYSLDNVLADDSMVSGDHSIQNIIPYIQRYFPDSIIIPILVSAKYKSLDDLNKNVENFVSRFGKEKTLYIASIDFAHNINLDEGIEHNTESIENISKFNYSEILDYNDSYMDSPMAITSFLLTMQKLGALNWETWYSSHGALITNELDLQGTSYVVGTFTY